MFLFIFIFGGVTTVDINNDYQLQRGLEHICQRLTESPYLGRWR